MLPNLIVYKAMSAKIFHFTNFGHSHGKRFRPRIRQQCTRSKPLVRCRIAAIRTSIWPDRIETRWPSAVPSGLYYYRARYYDPATGRLLNEDPERFGAGENFYAYVDGSPTNFIDPFGLTIGVIGDQANVSAALRYLSKDPQSKEDDRRDGSVGNRLHNSNDNIPRRGLQQPERRS